LIFLVETINLNIKWSDVYEHSDLKGNVQYRRHWLIPSQVRSQFFKYWKNKGFELKTKGFSVTKQGNDWFLIETKKNEQGFSTKKKNNIYSPPLLSEYKLKCEEGLRSWQKDSVSKLCSVINKVGCAVDGSEMGVGKTYCSIAVARELNVPFVVICPKAVKGQWTKVAIEHFKLKDKFLGVMNYELLIRGRKDSNICELVKDRSTRRHKIKWKLPKNTLIIYDEAHKLKNFTTKNSKFCMDAYKNGYKLLFLSATMAINPIELRTIGSCLKLFKTANEYYEWLQEHGCFKGRWSWEFNNDKNVLTRINKYLFEDHGIRLKRDLIPNFPETEIIVDAYDLDEDKTSKINQTYSKMHEEIKKLNELKKNSDNNELLIRLRNRQIVELLKTDLFIELAREGLEAGMSIIIFLNYSKTVDVLSKALNTTCIFDGRLDEKTRDKNLENFQLNKEPMILVNLKAGNMGLNMPDLDGFHPRLSLISPDDSAVSIKQCLGRAVRENSKSKTIQKIVLANNTVETKVMSNLSIKLENMDLINDGDLKI
jgi:superfamily II DNA or RNA helicase